MKAQDDRDNRLNAALNIAALLRELILNPYQCRNHPLNK